MQKSIEDRLSNIENCTKFIINGQTMTFDSLCQSGALQTVNLKQILELAVASNTFGFIAIAGLGITLQSTWGWIMFCVGVAGLIFTIYHAVVVWRVSKILGRIYSTYEKTSKLFKDGASKYIAT